MQLTAIEIEQHIETTKDEAQDSDMPVEENVEALLPEDGILLTYVVKQIRENDEMEATDNWIQPVKDVAAHVTDIPMSRDTEGFSEKSQKSQESIKQVETAAVTPSTSQQMTGGDGISEEETIESQSVRLNMMDKLEKAVGNLGNEVRSEEDLRMPAIDLMMRIKVALDEQKVFPENTTVNILDIINEIPDKSALAWREKSNGGLEIDSYQVRALAHSVSRESHTKEQERKQEMKDIYITQKCTEVLQNVSKTYEFVEKMAAGLVDLVGMWDGGSDFKDMMKVVVGLPSMIQQQTDMKIKEAEEKGARIQDRKESVSIKSLDNLMTVTILPKFKSEWEEPQFKATKYLAAIFEFWLQKGMFPERRPNIHHIAVKFRCSLMELQKYLQGSVKSPNTQQPMNASMTHQHKRRKVLSSEEMDNDTENVAPKRNLRLRKNKITQVIRSTLVVKLVVYLVHLARSCRNICFVGGGPKPNKPIQPQHI